MARCGRCSPSDSSGGEVRGGARTRCTHCLSSSFSVAAASWANLKNWNKKAGDLLIIGFLSSQQSGMPRKTCLGNTSRERSGVVDIRTATRGIISIRESLENHFPCLNHFRISPVSELVLRVLSTLHLLRAYFAMAAPFPFPLSPLCIDRCYGVPSEA